MILYSAKSTIDAEGAKAYRVTKFNDGEVESSYLTTGGTCDCPAGVRPTCRHRQMLPDMIRAGIVNTHYFWDYDISTACDFQGTPKWQIEALVDDAPVAAEEVDLSDPVGEALQGDLLDRQTFDIPDGYEAVRDAKGRATGEVRPIPAPASPKPWRRM
jgi:hypothetical protein